MDPIVALSLGHSSNNIVGLVIELLLVVVNFLAVSKIITKAGYSSKWILVPLAPVVLWAITFILLLVDVRSVAVAGGQLSLPVSLSDFVGLEVLDFLSLITTWIFFLIFAFSDWPVGRMPRRAAEPPPGRPPFAPERPGPARPPTPGPGAAPAASAPAPAVAAPSTVLVDDAPAPARTVIYCSWCGKERAVDSHAIHHCGSKERPTAYCMNCGSPRQEGAADCASCGTPATQISK
jgi:hypothetical protein